MSQPNSDSGSYNDAWLESGGGAGYSDGTITVTHHSLWSPIKRRVVDEYPITNLNYKHVRTPDEMLNVIVGAVGDAVASITSEIRNFNIWDDTELAWSGNGPEVFVGRLRDARFHISAAVLFTTVPDWVKDGHVYDPWFRDITDLNLIHYKPAFSRQKHVFSAFIGNNFTKFLVFWLYNTTVDGIRVKLLLYDLLEIGYCNAVRSNKHYNQISPFSVMKDTQYNIHV